jgi:hypothetical protein
MTSSDIQHMNIILLLLLLLLGILIFIKASIYVPRYSMRVPPTSNTLDLTRLTGKLTPVEKKMVYDTLRNSSKEKKRQTDPKLRWHIFASKEINAGMKLVERKQDNTYFWTNDTSQAAISEANIRIDYAKKVVDMLSHRIWGKTDPRSKRLLQLFPDKYKIWSLVYYKNHNGQFSAGDDIIYMALNNIQSPPQYGKVILSWKFGFVHELAHYLCTIIPGAGGHNLIFWKVLADMNTRLISSRPPLLPVTQTIIDLAKKIDDPMYYGLLVPIEFKNDHIIESRIRKWSEQCDDLKDVRMRTACKNNFKISEDDIDWNGHRYLSANMPEPDTR